MVRRALTLLLVGVLLVPAGSAGSGWAAEEPPFVGWTALLPALPGAYDPGSPDDCQAGRPQCVDRTIRAMSRRLVDLAAACDHNAVFSLAYLRTTEVYREAALEPGFFHDPPFVNHEDAVFAAYYFSSYDACAAGRRALVPLAWRTAFDAAAAGSVTGSGNLLLGMNAHVNRDLPFVLASIGLVDPGGGSRKPDHDKVNAFLNRVVLPLMAEEAARFDPTMDDGDTPGSVSYTALMQLLLSWREQAWRNAERLVAAPDEASRDQVARQIEASSAATAELLRAQNAYLPPATTRAARDAHCAVYGRG